MPSFHQPMRVPSFDPEQRHLGPEMIERKLTFVLKCPLSMRDTEIAEELAHVIHEFEANANTSELIQVKGYSIK